MPPTEAPAELAAHAQALREMAQDFRDISMTTAAELCDEKAAALEAQA